MMQISLFKWLKHLALVGVFLLFEPLIGVLYYKVLGVGSSPFWGLSWIVLVGYLGYCIQKGNLKVYQKLGKGKSLCLTLVDVILGALMILGITLTIYQEWLFLMLGMSILTLGAYIVGTQMVYRDYHEIYSPNLCRVLIGLGVISVLIVDYPAHILVVIYNLTIYYIINNQGTIDQLLERTKKNVPVIAQIRSYNIKLISGIMFMFLVGYLVKDNLANILNWIIYQMKQGLIAFLNYLASLQSETSVIQETVNEQQMNASFLPSEVTQGNKWLDFIALVIGIILIIILLRYAIKGLYKLYRQMIKWIKVWSDKVLTTKEKVSEEEYYYDQVENLDKAGNQERKLTSKKALRKWKKELQNFKEQEDSTQKYRMGYKLILEWFNLRGVPLPKSNTTWELCEKRRREYPSIPIEVETRGYNKIRYGQSEEIPQEIDELKETLEKMNH